MIAIDLSKQQALDADPKAIQQINFYGNLENNETIFFIIDGAKETNVTGSSNDETNFPHRLLLTNTQVSRFCKAFANNSSANIKLSRTQLYKIEQSGGFLGRLLGPLLKTGLPLIGNVPKPLPKSVLIPLGLTAAASTTDEAIHKKCLHRVRRY